MKTGRRKIAWDVTCWLAWLNGEGTDIWPANVVQGIQDVVDEVENNRVILFASTIMKTEIFVGRLSPERHEDYRRLMRRRNVREMDATTRVTELASLIREHHSKEGRSIHTPDAIHLATAIIYEADEFQTMDGLQKGGSKHRKLLSLSGNVAGYPLKIVHPYPLHGQPPAELVTVTGPLFAGASLGEGKDNRPTALLPGLESEDSYSEKTITRAEESADRTLTRISAVPRLGTPLGLYPKAGSGAGEDEAEEE